VYKKNKIACRAQNRIWKIAKVQRNALVAKINKDLLQKS